MVRLSPDTLESFYSEPYLIILIESIGRIYIFHGITLEDMYIILCIEEVHTNNQKYHGDTYVRLFTHTHMVGSGITEYGNVGFIPGEFFHCDRILSF